MVYTRDVRLPSLAGSLVILIALASLSSGDAIARGIPGAKLVRNDHVRVWISDPMLMPTRPDGSPWVKNATQPKLQVSIRLKKGVAKTKVVSSSTPSFEIAPFNVAPGEKVRVQLWELGDIEKDLVGTMEFTAGAKADTVTASSTSIMMFNARTEPVDVWSIPELPLVVPFRVDDAMMSTIDKGLAKFHKELHRASRGQIRIERYRFYELPGKQQAKRLGSYGVRLSKDRQTSAKKRGTPGAPTSMLLGADALRGPAAFSEKMLGAFEMGVLGAKSPPTASKSPAPTSQDRWSYVRVHLKSDLNLGLLPAPSKRAPVASTRADIDIVRANTVDF